MWKKSRTEWANQIVSFYELMWILEHAKLELYLYLALCLE